MFKLAGVRDAYEFSLVAVPCQRSAGVSKSYTGETIFEEDHQADTPQDPNLNENGEKIKELTLRARLGAVKAKTKTSI